LFTIGHKQQSLVITIIQLSKRKCMELALR
jgi:hypothetical protein